MDLKTYIATHPKGTATQLAKRLGISTSYLSQMAARTAAISTVRMVRIEKLTDGIVHRRDMFPTDYADRWPELAQKEVA